MVVWDYAVREARWCSLVETAKSLNVTLQTTKKEFVAFTEQQAKQFVRDCIDFLERMNANGPVKCSNLDVGLTLFIHFQAYSPTQYIFYFFIFVIIVIAK